MSRLKSISLKTQITILIVGLVVLSTAVVGAFGYSFTRHAIEREAMRGVGLIASSRKDVMLAHLQNRKTRLNGILRVIEKTCAPEPANAVAIATNGGSQQSCVQRILEQFANYSGALELIFEAPNWPRVAIGAEEPFLVSSTPPTEGEAARFTKTSQAETAITVIGRDASTQASIFGLFKADEVNSVFAEEFGLGHSGEAFLADAGGNALTRPQHHSEAEVSKPLQLPGLQACAAGADGEMLGRDDQGHSSVIGYRAVPQAGGLCVITHVDEAEAFTAADQLRRGIILGCLFFALLASLLGLAVARLITRPLSKLAEQAEALKENDLDQKISVEGPREIRALASAFAAMAAKLIADLTEIKNSGVALEQSEDRLKRAIIDAPYPTLICTDDGEILQMNRALLEASGYAQDEIPSLEDWLKIVQPHDFERVVEQVMRVAESSAPLHLGEFDVLPKSGQRRVWSLSSAPLGSLRDGRGMKIVMAADFTDRRRADEAVRLGRERLDLILRSVNVGLWHCDLPSRALVLDEKAKEQFGFRGAGDLTLNDSFALIHPDDRGRVITAVEAAIGSANLYDVEFRTLGSEGVPSRWLRMVGRTFFDQEGRALRFEGISAEISDVKRSQEVAQDQQQWLESVLNLLPIPLVLVEPRTARVSFSNDAADRLGVVVPREFGLLDEEAAQSYFTDSAGRTLETHEDPFHRVAAGQKLEALEANWRTSEKTIPLVLFSEILPPMFGHSKTNILMFQDVTDLKGVQVELSKAVRSRDEFLATLSHELRTPLNVILGWIDILESEKSDPSTVDKAIDTLGRNSTVLKELIDELLEVSRIISGKLESKLKPMQLNAVVAGAANAFRPRAQQKEIKLSVSIEDKPFSVNGDATRLTQVLSNLLQNAIKFTETGGRIAVSLKLVGERAVITVKDNGIGISKSFLPFVFDRLKQENMGTTRAHGGLGLGLAITKHIVESHGGSIRVESGGRSKGSVFVLELPLLRGPEVAAESKSDTANPTSTSELNGLKVLVVDDSPDILTLVSKWLKDQGAVVTTAESAREGFERLEDTKFDVLLSDIGMPEEDGYSFIDRVRGQKDKTYRQIPAGALTAYARAEERKQIIAAGFQLHVTKPVNRKTLIVAVKELADLT